MTKKSKQLCQDCYDDYYNQNRDEGCWMFKTAKVVKRVSVGTWDNPPYPWRPREVLSCFHQQGRHFLHREDPRVIEDTHGCEKGL